MNPRLKDLVQYTPAQQAVLDKINADTRCTRLGILDGIRLGAPATRWSTIEGLQWQIDHFTYDCGILFYFKVIGDRAYMQKVAWDKRLEGHELEFWL